ncbi:MAG: bifunctional metallophosphatase/5'-nucleotidase [Pseudomonadota bacterium]
MNTSFRSPWFLLAATALLSACAAAPRTPLEINLVALNDFHGHLEAHKFTPDGAAKGATVMAGGIDTLAAALQAWRRDDPELLMVAAGDLVGASPAMSSMWADEPTLNAMNLLGLNVSSVGNHEFDQGRIELLRQQNGGCQSQRPDKACQIAPNYGGARFSYLAANVLDSATGKPFLPAFRIEQSHGVKIAFIGAVLRDTASVVLASGIAGLSFVDEADAANRAVAEARAQGATVFVLLIHEGGRTDEPFDQPDCQHLKGPIVGIARRLDPAIRLVVSGHTHRGFLCKVDGRTITQAEMGGHVLSRIKLTVDAASGAVQDISARNEVMIAGAYPPVPQAGAYLAGVRERSAAALARPVARVAVRSVGRAQNRAGEGALGDLIADAVLAATHEQGTQIGFMNIGGIRKDLDVAENLNATYGQAQVVLPFGNTLVVMDMSGAQIRGLLEQQWQRPHPDSEPSTLQVSNGFSYRWDPKQPKGQRVVAGSMALNGVALDEAKLYRVVANNFLAEGGDSFPMFAQAANKQDTQMRDIDALVAYLVKHDRAGTPAGSSAPAARIIRVE